MFFRTFLVPRRSQLGDTTATQWLPSPLSHDAPLAWSTRAIVECATWITNLNVLYLPPVYLSFFLLVLVGIYLPSARRQNLLHTLETEVANHRYFQTYIRT